MRDIQDWYCNRGDVYIYRQKIVEIGSNDQKDRGAGSPSGASGAMKGRWPNFIGKGTRCDDVLFVVSFKPLLHVMRSRVRRKGMLGDVAMFNIFCEVEIRVSFPACIAPMQGKCCKIPC